MTFAPTKLLVVDDDPVDREIYRRLLSQDPHRSYSVVEAGTAEEALALHESERPDCILLDYRLPDSDGVEFLRMIALEGDEAGLPVVMLTGQGSEKVAVEAMKAGAQDYAVKGELTSHSLAHAIESAIEKVALRRELQRKRRELDESRRRQLKLKDEFLSHVSHELRTPLTAIHQFLSILLDGLAGELNAEQRNFLGIAFRNTKELTAMIGDLVEVTRAESGKLRLEMDRVEIRQTVLETVHTLAPAAAAKELSLRADLATDLPSVLGDGMRVRQVLINLINNAIKFTPEGGEIIVESRWDPDHSGFVRTSVIDTGCGISNEGVQRIFDRLHQERTGQPQGGEGLGLGLFISRELVTRHGGRIWVESKLGEGSKFHFTLPAFCFPKIVAPALTEDGRLRESYSLIRVDLVPVNANPSSRISESLRRQVRHVLGTCIRPDEDVLLPRIPKEGAAETYYIVAGTGSLGMESILRRTHRLLGNMDELEPSEVRVYAEGRVAETSGIEREPLDEAVRKLAERIEALIEDEAQWEAGNDGKEDSDRR